MDRSVLPEIDIGSEVNPMLAFHLEHLLSRYGAVIWSHKNDQLAWLHCHNEARGRIGGVLAKSRLDHE